MKPSNLLLLATAASALPFFSEEHTTITVTADASHRTQDVTAPISSITSSPNRAKNRQITATSSYYIGDPISEGSLTVSTSFYIGDPISEGLPPAPTSYYVGDPISDGPPPAMVTTSPAPDSQSQDQPSCSAHSTIPVSPSNITHASYPFQPLSLRRVYVQPNRAEHLPGPIVPPHLPPRTTRHPHTLTIPNPRKKTTRHHRKTHKKTTHHKPTKTSSHNTSKYPTPLTHSTTKKHHKRSLSAPTYPTPVITEAPSSIDFYGLPTLYPEEKSREEEPEVREGEVQTTKKPAKTTKRPATSLTSPPGPVVTTPPQTNSVANPVVLPSGVTEVSISFTHSANEAKPTAETHNFQTAHPGLKPGEKEAREVEERGVEKGKKTKKHTLTGVKPTKTLPRATTKAPPAPPPPPGPPVTLPGGSVVTEVSISFTHNANQGKQTGQPKKKKPREAEEEEEEEGKKTKKHPATSTSHCIGNPPPLTAAASSHYIGNPVSQGSPSSSLSASFYVTAQPPVSTSAKHPSTSQKTLTSAPAVTSAGLLTSTPVTRSPPPPPPVSVVGPSGTTVFTEVSISFTHGAEEAVETGGRKKERGKG